jgi:hypothetical protein
VNKEIEKVKKIERGRERQRERERDRVVEGSAMREMFAKIRKTKYRFVIL